MIALDEFALQSTPYTHYAWAEKNTKPKIWSDERHRQKLNGFLTVDVQRGSTRVDFKKTKLDGNGGGDRCADGPYLPTTRLQTPDIFARQCQNPRQKNGGECPAVAGRHRTAGGTAGLYPQLLAYAQLLATTQPCRIPDP